MTTQTVQTIDPKNLTFLPKEVKKYWRKEDKVYISASQDMITIKKTTEPTLSLKEIDQKLKKIGKNITKKDIEEAIKWARRQKQ